MSFDYAQSGSAETFHTYRERAHICLHGGFQQYFKCSYSFFFHMKFSPRINADGTAFDIAFDIAPFSQFWSQM